MLEVQAVFHDHWLSDGTKEEVETNGKVVLTNAQARAQNWVRHYYTCAIYASINLTVFTTGMSFNMAFSMGGPILVLLVGEVRYAWQSLASMPAFSRCLNQSY